MDIITEVKPNVKGPPTLTDQAAYQILAKCEPASLGTIKAMLASYHSPARIHTLALLADKNEFVANVWQHAAAYIVALEAAAGPATTCEHGCNAADGDYCEECHAYDRADERWDSRCNR